MPRQKRMRRVSLPPPHLGFKVMLPPNTKHANPTPIRLFMEEFEAIKLMDYEMLSQVEAATHMQVSRPTITRIYESARQKLAQSIVEGRALIISGGNYVLSEEWFLCTDCGAGFNRHEKPKACIWCGSKNVSAQHLVK
jgi:uncharacterized protein